MAKGKEYWEKRFTLLEDAQSRKGAEYFAELEKQYRKASLAVQKDVERWYARLAENNELTMQGARKLLNKDELEEFQWNVLEYIEKGRTLNYSDQWAKQLENASARFHLSRMEAIRIQMQNHVEVLYGNESDEVTALMENIYTEGYYHTAYEIQKGFNIGYDLMKLDANKVEKVLSKPWAADGSNFSSRIWTHKAQLVSELHNGLTQAIIRGQHPHEVTKSIAKRFDVSKGKAGRLVMTEAAFFNAVSNRDCYKDLGVERYEILATLDRHTSDTCRALDGKVFAMSEYAVGATAPPFHVWCRTTTVPYFDDEFELNTERAARGEDGKTYYVPADMKYKDWKKTFVDGGSKDDVIAKDRLGILTNNNKSNPQYYYYKGKDLREVETEISKHPYETAVIFKNGKAINCQIGNDNSIEFTRHQLKQMKGADVTHNHPLSTPPSPEDLYLMIDNKANSFRTCGKNGVYVLEYTKEIDNLPNFKIFSAKYDEVLSELQPTYIAKVQKGMPQEEALIELGEAVWAELQKVYGVAPIFERR